MEKYNEIEKESIIKTLKIIDDLSMKFKTTKINDFNWVEFAKYYELKEEDFYSMFVFIDALNTMKSYMDVMKIDKILVKRNEERWKFFIYEGEKELINFLHTFKF